MSIAVTGIKPTGTPHIGNYILMSADILFPGAQVVPVGLDQKQHIEIADDIANAFNLVYGPILTVPRPLIDERVMTIPGLDGRKMSKSYDNVIPLVAPPAIVRRAVMRIKTDSRRPEEPKDPDTDLIFGLYRRVAQAPDLRLMRERYLAGGLGYGKAKAALADALEQLFREPRERYEALPTDREELDRILARGAEQVRERGSTILAQVRAAVGIGPR